ncbi:MAG: alpha/beta hydrolase [Alphaproteobacteria bacterium]|nr:alpha/beta hydrolase [Alphaproteobacteria bacterium]
MNETLLLENGGKLSFRRNVGSKETEIVFMHGTLSDKNASKSLFLEDLCKKHHLSYTAFDFIGHGESSGKYTDGTIGIWLENALEIIDRVTTGQLILVGSSMGGWIALLAAQMRPDRVRAVVGLAAAADFTVDVWASFSEEQKKAVREKGVIYTPNGWTEEGDPWTLNLFKDAEKYLLLKEKNSLNIDCPITLIHGAKDDCVPLKTAFKIMDCAKTENVKVIVLKNSGHRLSEPHELDILETELLKLLPVK